jgi:hypothetical protein
MSARIAKSRQKFSSCYQTKEGNRELNTRGARNIARKVSITAGGRGSSPNTKK